MCHTQAPDCDIVVAKEWGDPLLTCSTVAAPIPSAVTLPGLWSFCRVAASRKTDAFSGEEGFEDTES